MWTVHHIHVRYSQSSRIYMYCTNVHVVLSVIPEEVIYTVYSRVLALSAV
jgi:hypothetical protein